VDFAMLNYDYVKYEKKNNIAFLTINRPEALNALNQNVLNDIKSAFEDMKNDGDIKAVIITGEGRAFVAGADIAQMRDQSALEGREFIIFGQKVMNMVENFEKPVIAAVNGFALGGGCELCLSADIRIASTKAKFGQPEVSLGIIPGFGATQRLSRLVGKGMAKYLIYTGDIIDSTEALRIGLVEKVVEPEKLMEECENIANKIASNAPIAIEMAKLSINNGMNMDLSLGINYEAELFTTCFGTEDKIEGMTAFLEKRPANFKNA